MNKCQYCWHYRFGYCIIQSQKCAQAIAEGEKYVPWFMDITKVPQKYLDDIRNYK